MNKLIPVVALILGAGAYVTREKAPVARASTQIATSAVAVQQTKAEAAPEGLSRVRAGEAPRVEAIQASASSPLPAVPLQDPNVPLVDYLTSVLGLNETQVLGAREIFEERARALSLYEAEVHDRGWITMDDFNHRVGELRGLSYRRLESLLTRDQARVFAALWPERMLAKDTLQISTPEEEVVLLD